MRRIAVFAAVLLAGALTGCLSPRQVRSAPHVPAACRAAVTPTGAPAAVDWTLANAATDRSILDAWCGTVGPAVVLEAAPMMRPPPLDDLIVISWNVDVGGGSLDALLETLPDNADRHRPVVVLLQEAYRDGPLVPPISVAAQVPNRIAPKPPSGVRRSVVDVARRRGLSLVYVPSMRNGSESATGLAEDRGNAILSTLPLSDVRAIELPFEHQRRVAIAASVPILDPDGRASKLRVVTAHLDTRAAWSRGGFLWFGRTRQARALVEAIEPIEPLDAPTILGGDFNSWLGELEPDVRQTRRRFPATPHSHAHVTFPLVGGVGLHLDHLFFSVPAPWHADVSTLGRRWGSDHYPLVGALSRPKETSP